MRLGQIPLNRRWTGNDRELSLKHSPGTSIEALLIIVQMRFRSVDNILAEQLKVIWEISEV